MSDDMFYARVCQERDQLRAELAAAKEEQIATLAELQSFREHTTALAADNARLRKAEKLAGKTIHELTAFAERWAPAIPHEGSCGPESGCDGICVEIAWLGRTMRTVASWKKLHETLAATPAQSLAAHDAALLREVAKRFAYRRNDGDWTIHPDSLTDEADRIEKEGSRG